MMGDHSIGGLNHGSDSVITSPEKGCHDQCKSGGQCRECGEEVQEARCWIYRAEGHTSLVVANLTEKIVYRLSKRTCKEKENSEASYDVMRGKQERGIDFVRYVMTPLIGRHLVQAGSLIQLEPGFADHINAKVAGQRPAYRKFQEVDPHCVFGVRLPDHCFIRTPDSAVGNARPTYSIEIKSKCGFLPEPSNICENSSVKRDVCRYCLHQYIKVETGKREQRSLYCPVNLYSGNYKRMANAMNSLFKTPQNNIRMFKDGFAIFGDDVQDINMTDHIVHFPPPPPGGDTEAGINRELQGFIDVVIKCLLYVPAGTSDMHHYPEQSCIRGNPQPGQTGSGLPRACVLGRLLYAQRLDSLDIERIYPLYERVKTHLELHPEDRRNWNLDGPFTAECWDLEALCSQPEDDGSVDFAVRKVREFLVSRTAKDCSMMVAIQPVSPQEKATMADTGEHPAYHVLTIPSGATYRFSIAVIDLDPKPWDKIDRYFREDSEIVAYHKQFSLHGNEEYLHQIAFQHAASQGDSPKDMVINGARPHPEVQSNGCL